MELIRCIPWVRFAESLCFTYQRGPSKTYDCRLLYAQSGAAELEMDGQVYRLRHGCMVLFQPGTEYCIRPEERITLTVLDFDYTQHYSDRVAFLSPCPADQFCPEQAHSQIFFEDAPELNEPLYLQEIFCLEPLLQNILSEFSDRQSLFRGRASTLLKDLLFQLVRGCRLGAEPQDMMGRLRRYIEANLHRRITNRELGTALNYNPNYLNRLVLSNTGMSLHQYVQQCRLASATKQLTEDGKTVQEIATGLGFYSASHFSNFFKQATGMTPVQFRKNHIL